MERLLVREIFQSGVDFMLIPLLFSRSGHADEYLPENRQDDYSKQRPRHSGYAVD